MDCAHRLDFVHIEHAPLEPGLCLSVYLSYAISHMPYGMCACVPEMFYICDFFRCLLCIFFFPFPFFCPTTKQAASSLLFTLVSFLFSTLHSSLPQQRATHTTHSFLHLPLFSALFFFSFLFYVIPSFTPFLTRPYNSLTFSPPFSLIHTNLAFCSDLPSLFRAFIHSHSLATYSHHQLTTFPDTLTHTHIHTYLHSTLALRFNSLSYTHYIPSFINLLAPTAPELTQGLRLETGLPPSHHSIPTHTSLGQQDETKLASLDTNDYA